MRCGGREDFVVVVVRGEENCEIPELVVAFLASNFRIRGPTFFRWVDVVKTRKKYDCSEVKGNEFSH